MPPTQQSDALDQSSLSLAEQVVRLQALLEASRSVHSTIELTDVLQQSARNHPGISLCLPEFANRFAVGSNVPQVCNGSWLTLDDFDFHGCLRCRTIHGTILYELFVLSLTGLAVRLIEIAFARRRLLQAP